MSKKIESYTWRDQRLTSSRSEKAAEYKMIDMLEYQLQQAYDHCKTMLYNNNPINMGRMLVLDMISEQIEYCGAELALRWFKTLKDNNGNYLYSNESLLKDINSWMSVIQDKNSKTYRLQDFILVPQEYKGITIDSLTKACKNELGYINLSKITFAFIFRQGIYFTEEELKEMYKYTFSNSLKEKFDILKYQLGLKDDVVLKANPNGLTEQQFRDMIHVKKHSGYNRCKYSELTTSQLKTLRERILHDLEEEVMFQVNTWTILMKEIKEVANYKKYTIIL